jgi:stage III sporulation protein AC
LLGAYLVSLDPTGIRKEFPMDISLIIKVAGVGILVSVATQILSKSGRDEQSMLVTLAGIVVVLLLLVDEIALLFDRICAVFGF